MKLRIKTGRHLNQAQGEIVETDIDLRTYYPDKFELVEDTEETVVETEEVDETEEETKEVEETEEEEAEEVVVRKRISVHRGRGKYSVYELDVNDFMDLDSHDEIDDVGELIAEGLTKKEAQALTN